MNIGFIGLGNMGTGMVRNILKNMGQNNNLNVYTRTKSKIDSMVEEGATGCYSLKELTTNSDIILTCLPNVDTSRDLILGSDGIINHANSNQILVDHSTVDIKTSQDCSNVAAEKNISFLDAPISGGPIGASEGTLTIMVGGNKTAFEKSSSVFEMMGGKISHMGKSGAGTAMKLVNQLLVSTNTVAAAEAFVLAEQAGVDLNSAIDILSTSWGQSQMIERNGPITVEENFENSAAPLRNLIKDLNILEDLRLQLGLELPVTQASSKVANDTNNMGLTEPDIAATALTIKKLSSIE
ncbi:MAG: hypothetical protein CL764_02805 [Chloroflexi bacterium]|nr:hypothetical protein [Chloroflexota bacterium]|tara:strand:+ start:506 stop:1393 length:888 start_codon:yes stop_codon:yes gene_type:complete